MTDKPEQLSYYERDGIQFPRVTHILKVMDKSGLARWRGRVGNAQADEISREGSRIGTEFHELAHEINQGRHMTRGWQAPGEYRFMASAYIDWLHKYVARIEQMETTYYYNGCPDPVTCRPICPHVRFAGTLDMLAHFRGDPHPSIIDLKTSNSVSDDWPLQLSAYRMMVRAEGKFEVARRVIVRIPKVGKVEAETYDYSKDPGADDEDEAAWLEAYRLWTWQRGGRERQKRALVTAGLEPLAA